MFELDIPDDLCPIKLTESAKNKIVDVLAEENKPEEGLRVFVQGGGCSGFQYGFSFDVPTDDDFIIDGLGYKLLIDSMSLTYLKDAEIDYTEDLRGSQFVIKNPNAVTTCGCGASFSV